MSRKKGDIAEAKVAVYLKKRGFTILEHNFNTKVGEIDLIAKKLDVIHFIEVKSGSTFEPIYNITALKLSKIIKTAQIYLKKHKVDSPYCIDACTVKDKEITHLENITL
ncbi:MAG: YraN family protein [Thiovulaceae bacterium]|nr:YraN family protein [Sulfurimonadaceae bacterium]